LVVGAIGVVVARSVPLVDVSVGPVIFGWLHSFVVIRVFSICKFIGNVHEFWYYLWLDATHLLDKIWTAEPDCKVVNCSFVRDVLFWILYDAAALYVWTDWLIILLGTGLDFFEWCWPFVSWSEVACELLGELIATSDCLSSKFA
jgi:hypothetical protein